MAGNSFFFFTIDMLKFSPKDMKSAYKFFISAIIPRPIALVSSISEEGVVNVGKYLRVKVSYNINSL